MTTIKAGLSCFAREWRALLSSVLLLWFLVPAGAVLVSGPHATANKQQQDAGGSAPDKRQQSKTRLYIVRVVDLSSKNPIGKAKITVELENLAKNKWSGSTDSNGLFQFKWDAAAGSIRAHISIQARGYTLLDEYSPLVEDRLIQLSKAE